MLVPQPDTPWPTGHRSSPTPSPPSCGVQGLSYTVVSAYNKKETLYLLKDVTGYFRLGTMAALMGPSGSGKTSLLDLLAGRKTVGKTEGDILFAGNKPTRPFLRRYTGYVEQFGACRSCVLGPGH